MTRFIGRIAYFVYHGDRIVGHIHKTGTFMPAKDVSEKLVEKRYKSVLQAVAEFRDLGFRVER